MSVSREQLLVGCILLTGLVVRVLLAFISTSWKFSDDGNSWEFAFEMGQIAASIAEGRGFSFPPWSSYPGPTAWMPPVYPFIIASVFLLFGVYTAKAAVVLIFFQIAVSTASLYLAYLLGKRLFNTSCGLIAAVVLALYPPAIHFAVQKIWSTTLFSFSLLFLALIIVAVKDRSHFKSAIGIGVLSGLIVLIDPIALISYPFIVLWLLRNAIVDASIVVKHSTIAIGMFLITITPWLLRNYSVFEEYVFIKSNFGNELYLGNNVKADGSFHSSEARGLLLAEVGASGAADEVSKNSVLLNKAVEFINESPGQFIRLTIARFGHYWTFMMRPMEGVAERVSLLIYFGVLLLGVCGLVAAGIRAAGSQLILIFILTLPIPYYFTVVGLFRYRFPVEVFLTIFAAYAIDRAISYCKSLSLPR